MKNHLVSIFKAAIALGLLVYLFSSGKVDLQQVQVILQPAVLAAGLLSLLLVLIFGTARWRLLLQQQNILPSFLGCFRLNLIGIFFNFFVPGGVGGDLVKAVMIAKKHPENRAKVVSSIAADRIFGLFTMTGLALLGFVFELEFLMKLPALQMIFVGLLGLFIVFVLVLWILMGTATQGLRHQIERLVSFSEKLIKLWKLGPSYRMDRTRFLRLTLFSLASQIVQVMIFFSVAQEIAPNAIPASVFLFAVPVGFMVTAIPIAPAGVGVGQAAFYYLFELLSPGHGSVGVLGITCFQIFLLMYGLIGAGLFVWDRQQTEGKYAANA